MREQIKKEFADFKVKRKMQRIELIKQARARLMAKKVNPNATAVTQEINRLAEKNQGTEKLTFNQVYGLVKRKKVKLPKHDIDKKQLISRIRDIVANLEKPTLHKIVNELNKVEEFPRWNYDNLWHYLNDHSVSAKSLGIVSERSGYQAFLKDLIKAAKKIREETESVQIPLEKLREKLSLKPAAFANRIKRLNECLKKNGEKNLETKLAKLGLFIVRGLKEKKVSQEKPLIAKILSSEELAAKISEAKEWIEEIKKLEVNENTDIDKEEMVLLLRTMLKELKEKTNQDETLKNFEDEFHRVVKSKRNEVTKLKKQAAKRQKQLNRKIDLKHYDGSVADKLLDLIAERKSENRKLITTLLDRLWRKSMNGETLMGKDFEAISAAKDFLREVDSKTS